MNIFFDALVVFGLARIFFYLEKRTEKLFVCRSKMRGRVLERNSRKTFKAFSVFCQVASAIEVSCLLQNLQLNIFLFVLALLAIGLRIAAIRELKQFWSFDVELKYRHRLVNAGVYRFFQHPAYVGNIYVPLFYLSLGASITSLVSLVCVCGFYIYRTSFEDPLIAKLNAKAKDAVHLEGPCLGARITTSDSKCGA